MGAADRARHKGKVRGRLNYFAQTRKKSSDRRHRAGTPLLFSWKTGFRLRGGWPVTVAPGDSNPDFSYRRYAGGRAV
jgi:hypothetical protein